MDNFSNTVPRPYISAYKMAVHCKDTAVMESLAEHVKLDPKALSFGAVIDIDQKGFPFVKDYESVNVIYKKEYYQDALQHAEERGDAKIINAICDIFDSVVSNTNSAPTF